MLCFSNSNSSHNTTLLLQRCQWSKCVAFEVFRALYILSIEETACCICIIFLTFNCGRCVNGAFALAKVELWWVRSYADFYRLSVLGRRKGFTWKPVTWDLHDKYIVQCAWVMVKPLSSRYAPTTSAHNGTCTPPSKKAFQNFRGSRYKAYFSAHIVAHPSISLLVPVIKRILHSSFIRIAFSGAAAYDWVWRKSRWSLPISLPSRMQALDWLHLWQRGLSWCCYDETQHFYSPRYLARREHASSFIINAIFRLIVVSLLL